jgi:uncharacterized protein (TIGR02996 family)
VASLLVRVERGVLDPIRARATAEQAELQRGELPQPELSYLDPASVAFVVCLAGTTLRCVMTVHEPVLERGQLIGGDVRLHDHDLTPILDRLGCYGNVAEWSASPRVLPPNDVDLLRYELGLPLDARRNLVLEPSIVALEDEQDREILAEVWANPADDGPRMIYSDRLQQRADPRGELIALQLSRGDGRITERERQLVAKWGQQCTRPLANFLADYELRRGFLSRAIVDERQMLPQSLLEHPMWSLVEELQTAHSLVLRHAPLVSLRVLRLTARILEYLSSYVRTWTSVEYLLGYRVPNQGYRGIAVHDLAALQRICGSTVWPSLRALSVDTSFLQGESVPMVILRSALGQQLAHLDLTINPRHPAALDTHVLFGELARSKTIQRVSVLADFDPQVPEPVGMIYDRTPAGVFELTVQVPPYGFPALLTAVPWIALLARGIDRVTVTYVPVRGRNHDVRAERSFIGALRAEIPTLDVADELRRPVCAWAYPRSLDR